MVFPHRGQCHATKKANLLKRSGRVPNADTYTRKTMEKVTRQQRRKAARIAAKEMARQMVETHKGVPRSERRRICFQIARERLHNERIAKLNRDKLSKLDADTAVGT